MMLVIESVVLVMIPVLESGTEIVLFPDMMVSDPGL
jgi:hypothetical protein